MSNEEKNPNVQHHLLDGTVRSSMKGYEIDFDQLPQETKTILLKLFFNHVA